MITTILGLGVFAAGFVLSLREVLQDAVLEAPPTLELRTPASSAVPTESGASIENLNKGSGPSQSKATKIPTH